MSIDPYASCPCGSGKKFKWCCQDIHAEVEKAFELHNAGQHDVAIATAKKVAEAHESNPEAWGRYSQVLALNGKVEEAEQALDKAFKINPNYAFGYFLRGQFRMQEGETVGALLLYRKAIDAYSPEAASSLAALYELVADLELRSNRPIASRMALSRAMALLPSVPEAAQNFEQIFGSQSRLPASARAEYAFRIASPAPAGLAETLAQAGTGKLSDARDAFSKLVDASPNDPALLFNLGLVKAWLGDNPGAIDALTKSVEHETDEARAAEAWAMVEVLRCGEGLEADADYVEHRAVLIVNDPNPVMGVLQKWEQQRRLAGMRANEQQGMLTGLVLDDPKTLVETAEGRKTARLGAYMLVAGAMMQLWHPNEVSLDSIVDEVLKGFSGPPPKVTKQIGPVMFSDVVADAMIFPTSASTELEAEIKVKQAGADHFEDKWLHQPLKSLAGAPPIDAAGSTMMRKRLAGIVKFIEDCAASTALRLYDFNRLRRKLGLAAGGEPASAPSNVDISSMSAADLAGLATDGLSESELGDAFRAAIKLDAKEIAGKFAQELLTKPATGDRWVYFNHLITMAQAEQRFDDALGFIDDGEKTDCEHNEGRRRNDYELRRGQVLSKRGDAAAADVFERLVSRSPEELKYLESATKSMIDMKQAAPAQKFAAAGLALARTQNNRDAEEYFLELSDAAKRLS